MVMLINTFGNTVSIFSLLDKRGVIRYTYRNRVCEIFKVFLDKYIRVCYGKNRIFKYYVDCKYVRTVIDPCNRSQIEVI